MSDKAEAILHRNKMLTAKRDIWMPLWQELSDVLYPGVGSFTRPLLAGQETSTEIYDTTPMQARRGLATAIDSLMKSSTNRWFWMKAQNDQLNDDDQAKLWFDHVGDRMWSAIYDPKANFQQNSSDVDNALAAFGLGYLWIGENRNRNGLFFKSLHIGDCAIDENSDGTVDTVFITRHFTARQALQRFGEDKLPPKVKEALKDDAKFKDKLFDFIQAIYPRDDFDPRKRDNKNMPFVNCIVGVDDKVIVEESGFQEFPVACPRWEVAPNEVYPRSPGMLALPDSRTLQAMGHTLLVGGQRAVDPPTWVADDGVLSAVRTFPGGLTVVDVEVVKATGGKPIGHLDMGANIPIGREMQQDYRNLVEAAFFKNVFNLPDPDQTGKMTAYEVGQRKQEFLRTLGPVLGNLENDYIGVTIARVYGIMLRAGQFMPPPDILAGQAAEFEFMSPIQQARRQIESSALQQAMANVMPMIQLQPAMADNIDFDEIARDIPDTYALPHKYIKPKDAVAATRQARAQAQQGAAALGQGQQGADIVKTIADAHNATLTGSAATQPGAAA